MSKIDLGRKWGDMLEPMEATNKEEAHYPTLHIGDIEDSRLAEMPDSGEMTIKYKIRSRTHNEHERKGKKCHSCSVTMDVTHIEPPAGKTKSKDNGARKALSEYFKDR